MMNDDDGDDIEIDDTNNHDFEVLATGMGKLLSVRETVLKATMSAGGMTAEMVT